MTAPVLAIDFDGTIAQYTHWQGESVCGLPIPGAVAFMQALHHRGFELWVFSARASTPAGNTAIWNWLAANGLSVVVSGVTHEKLYRFHRFVDDRAIAFTGANYAEILSELVGGFYR